MDWLSNVHSWSMINWLREISKLKSMSKGNVSSSNIHIKITSKQILYFCNVRKYYLSTEFFKNLSQEKYPCNSGPSVRMIHTELPNIRTHIKYLTYTGKLSITKCTGFRYIIMGLFSINISRS